MTCKWTLAFVDLRAAGTSPPRHVSLALLLHLCLISMIAGPSLAVESVKKNVTLLVPGIQDPLGNGATDDEAAAIPESWRSFVTFLQNNGHSFGGVVRPSQIHIQLPQSLDTRESTLDDARNADLFFLNFSRPAGADGLAFRALELAEAVRELRRFTGKRVNLVGHSAGGLAARVVLQRACPGIGEDSQSSIDRLITIGTPHLGAAIANNFGDLIGTRATSLKPDAGLIQRLNATPLPADVYYTSIIVRSLGTDVRSPGRAYDELIDLRRLHKLPADFQTGGDEIVHVRSQNMCLVPRVRDLEQRSQRAVQRILVRVPASKSSFLADPFATVHVAALRHPELQEWTARLLEDDGGFWKSGARPIKSKFMDWQVRTSASGVIEQEAISGRPLRQVFKIQLSALDEIAEGRSYRFRGKASWKELLSGETTVRGTLDVEFDEFGRLVNQHVRIERHD